MEDWPAVQASHWVVGADSISARCADFRRTPGERQRKEKLADSSTTRSTRCTIECGDQCFSTTGRWRRVDGAIDPRRTDSHDLRIYGQAGRLFVAAIFSSTGRGAFSFGKTKENGGRIPAGDTPALASPSPVPGKKPPHLPFKKPPKQAECPLDRDTATWYSVLEFGKRHRKGRCPGKTSERSRRWLQAALAPYRNTATALEPPTDT